MAACALFTPSTPHWVIFLALLDRRLLPLARIHRAQRHQLCRHRPAADEPGDQLRQRLPADVGRGRRRGRRDLHPDHPVRLRRPDSLSARDLSMAFVLVAVISSLSTLIFATSQAGRRRVARGESAVARRRRGRGGGVTPNSARSGAPRPRLLSQAQVDGGAIRRRCRDQLRAHVRIHELSPRLVHVRLTLRVL